MKNLAILLLALCINVQNSLAFDEQFDEQFVTVTTYTTKDGLPSNNIQDIVQDESGFIWLGTQEGLSRFDSLEFVNFTKDKSDKYSLPNILVEDLVLMPNDELWMSIYESGITVFDKFTQKSLSGKNSDSPLFQLPSSYLYGMAKDLNNNIWFSLYGVGIYQWNIEENKFYKYLSSDKNTWLTSSKTFEIMVDSRNRLWICTIDSKVYYYDINTGQSQFFDFSSDVNDPLSSPIYGFAESADGEIYAGGFSGVFKFDEKSISFNNIVSKSQLAKYYNGERTSVRRLMVDSKDNLWIGTTKSILKYTNNKLSRIKFYENGEILETLNLTIQSIVEGYDGNIWIGTEGLGLVKIAADWNRYKIYISQDKEPIDIRRAYQFKEKLWLIHTSSKMDQLEFRDGEMRLTTSLDPQLADEVVRIDSMYQDDPKAIWISSINGINKVDTQTGVTSRVVNQSGQKLNNVQLFHKAENDNFYFNYFSTNEIGYFNKEAMVAHKIENTVTSSFKGNMLKQISEGLDGNLWFVTDYGIESLNVETHQFNDIYKAPSNLTLSNFYIADNQKDVWVIADGGLYLFLWNGKALQMQNNRYQHILPLIKFGTIKRLKDNVLLITTEDSGLVEINVKSMSYKVYTKENGLPSDVIQNVLFPDGVPMVVTESGVALNNTDFKEHIQKPPRIVFDKIRLADEILKPDVRSLVLEHNYGALNFEVSLLSYSNSSMYEYEYMLQGASNEWASNGNDNKYSFLNLRAGDYHFKIRGRSNFGKWSDIQNFSFKVRPPPWKRDWAYLLYAVGILSIFMWFLYLYKRKILYEFEISKQQTQKHIANAASKAKSDFLAKMSHEVRTPLNGVLGMGELMQDTSLDEEQQIYAESIMASGKHLLEIINDILDLSKIEAGKLELECQPFNLLLLVDEIVGTFASQAKQKNLLLTCRFDAHLPINRMGDVIRIKQILFNLLGNSFKFTQKGEISLNVSASSKGQNYISIKVEDTGIGVDKAMVKDLFKPFVQADSAVTRKFGGTGLGLAIVKQLAEKMQGDIRVDGKLNVGSQFYIDLLLDCNENQINTDRPQSSISSVCLLVGHKHLKDSLVNSMMRLDIEYTDVIKHNTKHLFVDILTVINENKRAQINKALENKVAVYLIGFDDKNVGDKSLFNNPLVKLLSPPVTYKNITQLCCNDKTPIRQTEQNINQFHSIQRSLNILMIEDHSINQQVGLEMLEKLNHLVDVVDSAEEALSMLERTQYDLVMVDYHLPGMDGLKMIEMWDNRENVPVIVVTADLTEALFQQCHALGLDNIVAKPFTRQQLSDAISKPFSC